jgi:hypothetical protein
MQNPTLLSIDRGVFHAHTHTHTHTFFFPYFSFFSIVLTKQFEIREKSFVESLQFPFVGHAGDEIAATQLFGKRHKSVNFQWTFTYMTQDGVLCVFASLNNARGIVHQPIFSLSVKKIHFSQQFVTGKWTIQVTDCRQTLEMLKSIMSRTFAHCF